MYFSVRLSLYLFLHMKGSQPLHQIFLLVLINRIEVFWTLHSIFQFQHINILEPSIKLLSEEKDLQPIMEETGRIIYSNDSVTINLVAATVGFLLFVACKYL